MVRPLDPTGLLRAASHLDAAVASTTAGIDAPLSRFINRFRDVRTIRGHFGDAVAHARRGRDELVAAGDPFASLRSDINSAIGDLEPNGRHTFGKITSRRHSFVVSGPREQLRATAERLREVASATDASDDVLRARLQAELDVIAALPDDALDHDRLWRAAVIAGMPTHVRPEVPGVPGPALERHLASGRGVESRQVRAHVNALRISKARRELAADPTLTRASLDAEVRAILATPTKEVTHQQNTRLAMIAGLDDELRPSYLRPVPMPYGPWEPIEGLAFRGQLPRDTAPASRQYAAVRITMEVDDMLADPALDVAARRDELLQLLRVHSTDVDMDVRRRVSVLARLLDEAGETLPFNESQRLFVVNAGLDGAWSQAPSFRAEWSDVSAAAWVAVDPERVVADLRASIAGRNPFDPTLYAALMRHPEAMARAGFTDHDRALGAAVALGGTSGLSDDLPTLLQSIRDRLAAANIRGEEIVRARDEAVELADLNLRRLAGEVRGGYGRHPDYAELGRIGAAAQLLETVGHVADDASRAAPDTLSW